MIYTVLIDVRNPAGTQISREKFNELLQDESISATTQVWQPEQGRWIDAQAHPELGAMFTHSLWDAWDEATENTLASTGKMNTSEELVDAESPKEPLELFEKNDTIPSFDSFAPSKEQHSTVESQRIEPSFSPEEQHIVEEVITETEDSKHVHPEATIEPEVLDIDIPASAELPMLSEQSLIPLDEVYSSQQDELLVPPPSLMFTKDLPRRSRPLVVEESSGFSFVRVSIPIVVGGLLILGGLDYFRSLNERRFQPPPKQEIVSASSSPIWSLESSIRKEVGEDIIPLNPESSFEDILHIELQRTGITSIKIRAAVTEWTGRKLDQPKKIDVRIRAESTGELDRDIATLSLIMGKYIEYYFLDVERLEVCLSPDEDSYLCSALNSEVIRRYYLKRIEYDVFFSDVFLVP